MQWNSWDLYWLNSEAESEKLNGWTIDNAIGTEIELISKDGFWIEISDFS